MNELKSKLKLLRAFITDKYKKIITTHPPCNNKEVNLRIVDSAITMHGFYGTNDPKVKISDSEKPFFTIKRNQSEITKVCTVRVAIEGLQIVGYIVVLRYHYHPKR